MAIIQNTSAQYERDIEDLFNLPNEFIQVYRCFLVAKDTLSYARKNATWDESSTDSVQSSATSLEKKAKMLQKIFSQVGEEIENDSNDESVLDCYRDTLLKLGKSYRVEVLMLGLLKDLIALFTKDLLKDEDYMKFNELKESIDTMSQVKSSVSDDNFQTSGANFTQNVATGGTGHQSYYGGRGHHVFNGNGAITNYHATNISFGYAEGRSGLDSRHADDNQTSDHTIDHDQLQLRAAGQAQVRSRPHSREEFQIAIICALPVEYDVVSLLIDEFWDDEESYGRARGDMNSYTNGRMGQYDVVLALLPNMGTVAAAGAAASLRSSYPNLQLAFLVGICGGVPKSGGNEIHLGDVIISTSAAQYDLGKQYHKSFVIKDTVDDSLGRPNKNIRSLVASFETERIRDRLQHKACLYLKDLQSAAAKMRRRYNYQYPGINNDKLYIASYRHKHRGLQLCNFCDNQIDVFCKEAARASCIELGCDKTKLVKRTDLEMRSLTGGPEIFVGRVASGNSVIKSGEHRDRIAQEHNVIALEMEGAGVWDEIPCIIVKGVCDYADSHKNDLWQRYAAATAASVMKAVLERYIFHDS
ncbi:nucleoside phosphorylase domain-containing protein [Trichoderma afarasin]